MKRDALRLLVGVVFLTGVVCSLSGCTDQMRKKFVRQKNSDKKLEKLDVVYQPVEYSSDHFDAAEQYEHHFLLWKAWHTDLTAAIESGDSTKRKKYLLEHEIDAIRSMQYWISDDKKKDFDDMIDLLGKVDEELKKPEVLQGSQFMLRNLDIVMSKIRGEYDLSHVRDSLIQKP